ncbi:MAG TPA: MXAN_5187 C-terminal domain-containing protein [Polyangiaceae bacterium]|nr:MXAN_5187 C-terminal domain-containing protein [Polyangiaceae bacterium]
MRAKIIGLFSVIVILVGVLSMVLLRANLGDLVANPDQARNDAVRSASAAQARLELEALTMQRWLDEQSNEPQTREPFLRENESARSELATVQADRIFGLASSEFRQNPPALVAYVNDRGVALGRNGSNLLRGDNLGAAYPALVATLKKGITGSDVWVNRTRNEQMLVSYATVRDAQNKILGGIVLGTPLDDGRIGRTTELTSGRPLAFVSLTPQGAELVAKSGNVPEPALAWFREGALKVSPQGLEPGRPLQLPAGPPGHAGAVVAISGYGDGKRAALVALSPLGLGDSLNAALLPVIGFTTLLGILLVAFAGVVLSNYLTTPIVELERGLLAILNGQTERRFEIEHAEYGGLVFSINSLLNHLMGVQEDTTDAEGRPSRAPSTQQFREALSVDQAAEAGPAARLAAEPHEAYLKRLYDEYIRAKRSLGDPVDHITETAFAERIRASELETSQRLGKPVRFKVEVRGREVTLVAVPLE